MRQPAVAPRLLTLGTLALRDVPDAALGPRKLALLAYLALATRPLTRDHVAELFWGGRDEARARHSLREALSAFRRVLGEDAIARGGDVIALPGPDRLVVDVLELRRASDADDAATVVALHAGPFLDGVHVAGASPAFESWLAEVRDETTRRFTAACAAECRRLRDVGDHAARAALAQRWTAAAPLDPRAVRALLRALAAPGTRVALQQALDARDRLAARLDAEFGLAPDPSVDALADDLRRALAEHPGDPTPAAVHEAAAPPVAPAAPGLSPWRDAVLRRRARAAVAVGAIALAGAVAWAARAPAAAPDAGDAPFVVVLDAAGALPDEDCWLFGVMPHLVATALGRATELEAAALPGRAGAPAPDCRARRPDGAADLAAARREGATVVVRPTLGRTSEALTLDLEVRDLSGARRPTHLVVTDSGPFGLAEHAAVVLAGEVPGVRGTPRRDVSMLDTRSVDAYVAYIEALRLAYDGRSREAGAALDRAIAADSGFVAAVWLRLEALGVPETTAGLDSARRIAGALARHLDRATPYDRLWIEVSRAEANGEFAHAEQLAGEIAERWPHDARAGARYVELLAAHGRSAEALAAAQRQLSRDSVAAARAGVVSMRGGCGLCSTQLALPGLLMWNHRPADAERAARALVAALPDRPNVWLSLSVALAIREKWDEAVTAADRARALAPLDPAYAFEPARRLVEAGRLDEAARAVRPWLGSSDPDLAAAAADVEATRLRELGRHAEAARVLAPWRRRSAVRLPDGVDLVYGASRAALGDLAGAMAAVVAPVPGGPPSGASIVEMHRWRVGTRPFAWTRALAADFLVQTAEARGVAPDTVRLRALADSIEVIGAQSYYGRDWRLHHHVRGLIAAEGGRWAEAASELEQSRWPPQTWGRTLVALARAYLALGQPERALTVLDEARLATLDGMARYATRTELSLWIARTYHALGRADSAAVYAARVRANWRDADAPIRRRLALLDGL